MKTAHRKVKFLQAGLVESALPYEDSKNARTETINQYMITITHAVVTLYKD